MNGTYAVALVLPAAAVTSLRICLRLPLLHVLNGGGLSSRIVATESIKPATLAIFRPFFKVTKYGLVFNTRQTALLFLQNAKSRATQTEHAVVIQSTLPGY